MKKSTLYRFSIYCFCIFFITATIFSCNSDKKDFTDTVLGSFSKNVEPSIDFYTLDSINEANKKIIDIATLAYNSTKDIQTKIVLLKIKNDHQQIDFELKKLTKKNLILVSKPIYNLKNNPDSLIGKDSDYYFTNWLSTQIDYQIQQFDKIQTTSKNDDFKEFATKSKEVLEQNKNILESNLSI